MTLLAVVVLSSFCAAEAIVAVSPREGMPVEDGVRCWTSHRDRDASPSRSVRVSDARTQVDDDRAATDWSGTGLVAWHALRADGRWAVIGELLPTGDSPVAALCQISPHHLSLPPPIV